MPEVSPEGARPPPEAPPQGARARAKARGLALALVRAGRTPSSPNTALTQPWGHNPTPVGYNKNRRETGPAGVKSTSLEAIMPPLGRSRRNRKRGTASSYLYVSDVCVLFATVPFPVHTLLGSSMDSHEFRSSFANLF